MDIPMLKLNSPLRLLLSCLAATFITACTGVLESNKPAREVYLLRPPAGNAVQPSADAPRLVLNLVTVPGLDTDDIQVLSPKARLFPVANAHWADNLPEVMSSLSRRSLIDSGLFSSVSLGDIARPGNWSLDLELQAFYGVQDSTEVTRSVLMQLEGNLRCGDRSEVLRLQSSKNVNSDSLGELVAAHQQALDETLQQLPQQIREACIAG